MEGSKTESLIASLRRVGLSRYEASVYLGLVCDRTAKVAEISRRTGVPQPKVYQALESLSEKGFCSLGADEVNRYRPLPPQGVLEVFALEKQAEAEEARDLASELETLRREGEGMSLWAPPVEIVKGMRQIHRALEEHISMARETIDVFGKMPQDPSLEVAEAIRSSVAAGAKLRMLCEPGYYESKGARAEEIAILYAAEAERREIDALPTKLAILDGRTAIASVSRLGEEDSMILVLRNVGLVEHFRTSFETSWARARPST